MFHAPSKTQCESALAFIPEIKAALDQHARIGGDPAIKERAEVLMFPLAQSCHPLFLELADKELQTLMQAGDAALAPFVADKNTRHRIIVEDCERYRKVAAYRRTILTKSNAKTNLTHSLAMFEDAAGTAKL